MATMDYEAENGGRYDGERYYSRRSYESSRRIRASDSKFAFSGYSSANRRTDPTHYLDEQRYDRDRSASPRGIKREDNYRGGRQRSASPGGRMNSRYKII